MNNLLHFVVSSIIAASPLIAAALGGMYSEKSGIINIGLEGIMTFGAFCAAIAIVFFEQLIGVGVGSLILGLVIGILGGLLFALIHGILTITFKVDQIISGTVINILGLALALFLTQIITGGTASTNYRNSFPLRIGNIPIICILIILLVPLSYYIINYTKWGLRVKACGENPKAAKSVGINVNKVRMQAVLVSGIFGAIAGFTLVNTVSGNFSSSTVAGKGFIALAILIFGQWRAWGILLAGLLFGALSTLSVSAPRIFTGDNSLPIIILLIIGILIIISIYFFKNSLYRLLVSIILYLIILFVIFNNKQIPSVYFDIFPYIITIIALTYYSKNSQAPTALGES
ncbi:MAG: ABC transporter permease [Mycoplasmatales bacterium]